MQGVHLRKYGVETKIDFELYEVDGVDLRVDAVDAGSDCSIMKDEGAEATCTNDFVDEGKGYSITLSATEMQAARIVVYVVDSATKVWLDKVIVIETYGHASAMHALDLDTALTDATVGTCTTNTDMVGTNSAALASVVGALADAAADGEVTESDTLMKYIKQLINILIGTPGIVAFPAEGAPANGVSLAEVLRAIHTDTSNTLDALIKDVPTVAEFEARSDVAGTAATPAEVAAALTNYDAPTKAEMDTAHALLATPAQVNAQVVDALNVDTYAEPGQEAPAATASLVTKIGYAYKFLRNKVTNDGTNIKVYNDAGAVVDQKNTVSEAAGTVTRGKFGTGP